MTYSSKLHFVILMAFYPATKTTCSKVTACNLKGCKPNVQSQQCIGFNVMIGNNRKLE